MGSCRYRYNPSELYARTPNGAAPETHCGARTFPLYDEPEIVYRMVEQEGGGPVHQPVATGVFLPRSHDDPYCPAHGGTPEPDPATMRVFLERSAAQKQQELDAINHQLAISAPKDQTSIEQQPADTQPALKLSNGEVGSGGS